MLNIPASFKNANEDYITLPAIKWFMKTHDIKSNSSYLRDELFDKIIDFGNENDANAESVLTWIDKTIEEGIKEVYVKYAPLNNKMELLFMNRSNALKHLQAFINTSANKHICQNKYTKDFILIDVRIENSTIGDKVTFTFCKKLHVHEQKNRTTKVVDYPVIGEYYIDDQWLTVKAKPKSNLYIFNSNGFNLETSLSTTTEKQIFEIIDKLSDILGFEKIDSKSISHKFKNQIFNLLDKYTNTPQEIEDIMSLKSDQINIISQMLRNICTVQNKCIIPPLMQKDIDDDMKNIVEKYLSINWIDKDTFIKDRKAYPIKLSATDEEESKVEQTAAAYEPLQTKALFFDNKKMLYKNQCCDGVTFKWKRDDSTYFQKEMFTIRLFVKQNGLCVFKFPEYTVKEDIENVVFSIIGISKGAESTTDKISGELC